MAVTFDSVGPSAAGFATAANPASPVTWTHTVVTGGGNSAVLVGVNCDSGNSNDVLAVTFGGVSMTSLGQIDCNGTTNNGGFIQLFLLTAITAGANTVSVSWTGAGSSYIVGGSIAFTGYTGHGTVATIGTLAGNGTTATVTVPASTPGNLIAGFLAAGNTITSAVGPATSRFLNATVGSGPNDTGDAAGATSPAGGSVSVVWDTSSSSYCAIAVEVQGTAGGQAERMPQQLSRITKHRRGASQRPQFNVQSPSVNIHVAPVTASASFPAPGLPYIAGLDSTGQFFVDQHGQPRLMVIDNPWALITNAGEWNSGNWQADFTNYCASRAAQGFTGLYTTAIGCLDVDGSFQNGNMWDGTTPFVSGGDPSTGLNATYWARVDYLIAAAAKVGLTVFLNIAYTASSGEGTFDTGGAMHGLTQAQYTAYGTAIGNRYKASGNIVWMYGNDYFSGAYDTQFGYIRSAVIAAGDTHAMACHIYPESTSRYDIETSPIGSGGSNGSAFSASYSQVNWVYSYNILYYGIELAYEEAAYYSIPQLGAVWGDGYFYDSGASLPTDQMTRQFAWWAIASGARGFNSGSNDIWPWASGSAASVTTGLWWTAEAGILASAVQALPGWQTLMPDTTSTLVTAGRGTHGSGISTGSNYAGGTDNYVAASVTPGGTLAIIYCAKAFSITINQSVMVPGYTATWLDPTNGTTSAATAGSTYNSGTAKGNNSQGEPDWVLILQGTPAVLPSLVMAPPIPP